MPDAITVVLEEGARLVVAFIAVSSLSLCLLWGMNAAWILYGDTHAGQHFLENNALFSSQIQSLLAQSHIEYAIQISLLSLSMILPLALIMHFFHLRHFLYNHMPFFIKGAWAGVAAYFIANTLQNQLTHIDAQVAYFSVLPATLCFIPVCLTIVANVFPDLISCGVKIKALLD